MHTRTIASVIVICALVACGSDPSPVEACSGKYTCTGGKDPVQTELVKKGDSCTAGELTLNKDGTVSGLDGATWNGTSKEFKLCLQGECLVCASASSSSDSSSTSAPSGGKCTGSPWSCSSKSPPNCYQISGCSMRTRITYNNNFDNYCDGSPDSCDEMTDEVHCNRQGCTWKK